MLQAVTKAFKQGEPTKEHVLKDKEQGLLLSKIEDIGKEPILLNLNYRLSELKDSGPC